MIRGNQKRGKRAQRTDGISTKQIASCRLKPGCIINNMKYKSSQYST